MPFPSPRLSKYKQGRYLPVPLAGEPLSQAKNPFRGIRVRLEGWQGSKEIGSTRARLAVRPRRKLEF
jgi:hypothetical protein